MAIRKIVSRSIQDATVAAADFGGSVSSLSVSGASALATLTSNTLNVNAISTTLAGTGIRVFVYDTRKDSDGGAWRKRTNQTSWYNETLNTATRGSRRDFPAVAVIVYFNNSTVSIHDGDDPTLPMWMTFPYTTTASQTWYGFGSNLPSLKGLTALNGIIGICSSDASNSSSGVTLIKFITDGFARHTSSSGYNGNININISQRALTSGLSWDNTTTGINRNCNDIAMTVLPNAPIDAITGLPVPTIGVATDGGMYVIHNNGSVNSIQATDATEYNVWRSVGFTKDNKMIINGTYAGVSNNILHVCDIPYGNFSGSVVNSRITPLNSRYYHSDSSIPNLKPGQELVRTASTGINALALGGSVGLNLVSESPETLSAISSAAMVAFIDRTYNTGWIPGDIRGAWLSSSTAESLGTELVTNGTFTSNVTGWTNYGTSITWSSGNGGCAIVTPAAAAWTGASQTITTVVGRRYIATCTFISGSGYYSFSINETGATYAGKTDYNAALNPSNSAMKLEWTATTTTAYITIDNLNTTNTNPLTVDNVSVKLADDDRSAVNKGLVPYGTVTKAAVATGADLVGYSGWSASNYLMKPLDSAIHGTTTRFFAGWIKCSSVSDYQYIMSIGNRTGNTAWGVAINTSSGNLYTYDSTNQSSFATMGSLADNQWHFICVTDSGKYKELYVDGNLFHSVAISAHSVASDSNYYVGVYSGQSTLAYPFSGSLALQRFGITLPSRAQIVKMYNDEKYLFLENAKATLYGASSVITNLAYDDSTDLLHVGTSSGRSVFDGLRRVDNTTTAVSQSISASNGLVVEQ